MSKKFAKSSKKKASKRLKKREVDSAIYFLNIKSTTGINYEILRD
jgi:hypothetical protein